MDADPKPRDSDPDNWYVPHVILWNSIPKGTSLGSGRLLRACVSGANLAYSNIVRFFGFVNLFKDHYLRILIYLSSYYGIME